MQGGVRSTLVWLFQFFGQHDLASIAIGSCYAMLLSLLNKLFLCPYRQGLPFFHSCYCTGQSQGSTFVNAWTKVALNIFALTLARSLQRRNCLTSSSENNEPREQIHADTEAVFKRLEESYGTKQEDIILGSRPTLNLAAQLPKFQINLVKFSKFQFLCEQISGTGVQERWKLVNFL